MPTANLAAIMQFFELKPGEFRKEWYELSEEDKEQLKRGIGDGSLTY